MPYGLAETSEQLVGREAPMRALHDAFARIAKERGVELVVVEGAAGVGKTALLQALRRDLGARARVLEARGDAHACDVPFAALADALGPVVDGVLALGPAERGPLVEAIANAMRRLEGAYSVTALVDGTLVAFRDPLGFRPLTLGQIGDDWVIASETCALDLIGADVARDVRPGACPLRPARCSNRATPLGLPICSTRSTGRKSTPRSRLDVATTAFNRPSFSPISTQSRTSRASEP